MKNSKVFANWIYQTIDRNNFFRAFIFGSVAKDVENPGDCDILLVSKLELGSPEWEMMKLANDQLKENFKKMFNLDLSIQLLSESEFFETNSFVKNVLQNPIINIIL